MLVFTKIIFLMQVMKPNLVEDTGAHNRAVCYFISLWEQG